MCNFDLLDMYIHIFKNFIQISESREIKNIELKKKLPPYDPLKFSTAQPIWHFWLNLDSWSWIYVPDFHILFFWQLCQESSCPYFILWRFYWLLTESFDDQFSFKCSKPTLSEGLNSYFHFNVSPLWDLG